jgi:hypothetical protein
MAAGGVSGSTSAAGSTGTAGSTTASAGSGGKAGGTGGGGGGPAPVTAIAHIMPLASATTGSAGSGGSGAGGSAAAGGITGTALFTKVTTGVQLKIDIDGCTDGAMYLEHIHEGMSCDNAMTQGGHWGAVTAAAGSGGSSAAGSGGSSAGAGGHSAGAGGTSGGAGGSGGAAAGGPAPLMLRGEGINPIVCMGTMGSTALTRSTPDVRITWSIGGDPMTDVVGHVIVVHNANGDRIACGKIMMQ